jgi:hypothetical protein
MIRFYFLFRWLFGPFSRLTSLLPTFPYLLTRQRPKLAHLCSRARSARIGGATRPPKRGINIHWARAIETRFCALSTTPPDAEPSGYADKPG